MLKKYNGFTLAEVMIALFLLTSTMSILFPMAKKIYIEESALKEQEVAYHLLTNQLNQWVLTNDIGSSSEVIDNHNYDFIWQVIEPHQAKVCIQWKALNGRDYKQCGDAKR